MALGGGGLGRRRQKRSQRPQTAKELSVAQEEHLAEVYGGRRSPSSGASVTDTGDVGTAQDLMEAKLTGSYDKPAKSIRIQLADLEKIVDEAAQTGRWPVFHIQIVNPDSPIADGRGVVEWTLRPLHDDLALREAYGG